MIIRPSGFQNDEHYILISNSIYIDIFNSCYITAVIIIKRMIPNLTWLKWNNI